MLQLDLDGTGMISIRVICGRRVSREDGGIIIQFSEVVWLWGVQNDFISKSAR